MASKIFKKLGKSKLAKGLLAAAAVYFLGSYLSDSGSAAASDSLGADPTLGMGASEMGDITDPGMGASEMGGVMPPSPPPVAPPQFAAPPAPTPVAQPATPPPNTPTAPPAGPAPGSNLGSKDGQFNAGSLKWFSNLSLPAQAMLAQGVAGGTAAVMQALAQKNDQEAQEERDKKARDERTRRTAISAIAPGAFRARDGIMNSRRA